LKIYIKISPSKRHIQSVCIS